MSELYAHVLKLADELHVVFVIRADLCDAVWPGETRPDETCGLAHIADLSDGVPQGIVFLSAEPTTRLRYLLALHELGHLGYAKATGTFSAAPLNGRGEEQEHEAGAWRWALGRALFAPNACEWGEIAWRLKTYRTKTFEKLITEAERNARVTEEPHAGHAAGETDDGGSAGPAPAEPDTAGPTGDAPGRGSGEPLEPGRSAPGGDPGPGAAVGVAGASPGWSAPKAIPGTP